MLAESRRRRGEGEGTATEGRHSQPHAPPPATRRAACPAERAHHAHHREREREREREGERAQALALALSLSLSLSLALATQRDSAYHGSNYGRALVVVVYRHGEHAGALGLLARVEARHVRVLERLLRDRWLGIGIGLGFRCRRSPHVRVLAPLLDVRRMGGSRVHSIVHMGRAGRVGVPARRRAVLTRAVLIMPRVLPLLTNPTYYLYLLPLLTRSLLDVGPLLGVEVHEPLNQVDRLGYIRLQAGTHTVAGWDAYGCRLGCTRLQPEHTRYSLVTYGYSLG